MFIINGIYCCCLFFLCWVDNGWYVKLFIMILLIDYEYLLMNFKKFFVWIKLLKLVIGFVCGIIKIIGLCC